MLPASDKQVSYLKDLADKAPEYWASISKGKEIPALTRTEASQMISLMVAHTSENKKGEDSGSGTKEKSQDGGKSEGGDGSRHGEGHQGQGDGGGDGDGQGQHDGQGDGDGQGQNGGGQDDQGGENNQEGQQMTHEYRQGTKQQIVADALIRNNMDEDATFEELKDQIGQKPLEFKGKIDGEFQPLPIGEDRDYTSAPTQKGRTRKLIKDTKHALEQKNGSKQQGQQEQQDGEQEQNGQQDGREQRQETDAEKLIRLIREGRALAKRMNADGKAFDEWGMRQALYGARALNAGLPLDQILDAISMDWPKELRREWLGYDLKPFDVTKLWKPEQEEGKHASLPTLVRLAMAEVPIMLIGPAGTGKTTLAEQVNDRLNEIRGTNYEFGFASMTAGTSPGEFKGRITLDGFLPSLFCKIFSEGGVFLFDEIDAGDENLLTMLHAALANGYFVNNKGQKLIAHDHFVAMAAGNTMGLGATTSYTGRNRMDHATRDRFGNGRVRIELDEKLESAIYWNIINS